MTEAEITQADREAAAEYYEFRHAVLGKSVWYGDMREGNEDCCHLVQAFARHRLQARADALAEAAGVAEGNRTDDDSMWDRAADTIATAIRALGEK